MNFNQQQQSMWLSFILLIMTILASCGMNETKGQKLTADRVDFATISGDGRYLLNVSSKNAANLWDLKNKQLIYEWHNNSKESKLIASAISPDVKFAATVEAHNIALWNIHSGKTVAYWEIESKINHAAVGTEGHYVLLGLDNGKVYYVDMFTGKSVRTFKQPEAISALALSNDSRYAISGSKNHQAALWNVQTGENIKVFDHKAPLTLVAMSAHNEYAMTYATDGDIHIWRIPSGKLLRTIPISKSATIAQFAQDDRILAIADQDRKIHLWNVETGEVLDQWQLSPTQSDSIRALAITQNDSQLITEDADGKIYQKAIAIPR